MTPAPAKADVQRKLLDIMKEVNKKTPGSMNIASRVAFSHLVRIPSGIFKLDVDIGGGIPKGRTTMIVGEESVGKSTLCQLIIGNFQHTCKSCLQPFGWYSDEQRDQSTGEVKETYKVITESCPCGKNIAHTAAYFDAEGTFDPAWAKALGVDVPSLYIIQPEWAEQGADIMNAMVRSGELDLLIIDSIAMMTPGREVEESAEAGQRPDLALITNKLMRTLQASLNSLGMDNPNKPAILMVNQFRLKIGVMYGDPTTMPGGLGQKFAASIKIDLRAGKQIDRQGNVGGKDVSKIGMEIHYNVDKNKTAVPKKKGSFKLFYADAPQFDVKKGSVDNFDQMVEYGALIGLIVKSGAWFDMQAEFGDEFKNPGSSTGKFQGVDGVINYLKADPKKAQTVRDRIIMAVKNNSTTIPVAVAADADEDAA